MQSDKNLISIVSYIGQYGTRSLERRRSLREEVGKLNQRVVSQGVPRSRLVRLLIAADKEKKELVKESVSLHCDEQLSILDTCYRNEVIPIWFSGRWNRWYQSCATLDEVLETAGRLVLPRAYANPVLGAFPWSKLGIA